MASTENGASPRLSLGDGDLVLLGEVDEVAARLEFPLAPRRDHLDVGVEGVGGELEAHLVVALAGGAVGDGVGAGLVGDLDQALGDQRPGDRGAEQVDALVERVHAHHREDEVADELLAQVLDVDLADAQHLGLAAGRLELLALAEVGGEGHHLGAVGGLQPLEDDRGVEPAGVGENDLLDVGHRLLPLREGGRGRRLIGRGRRRRQAALDSTQCQAAASGARSASDVQFEGGRADVRSRGLLLAVGQVEAGRRMAGRGASAPIPPRSSSRSPATSRRAASFRCLLDSYLRRKPAIRPMTKAASSLRPGDPDNAGVGGAHRRAGADVACTSTARRRGSSVSRCNRAPGGPIPRCWRSSRRPSDAGPMRSSPSARPTTATRSAEEKVRAFAAGLVPKAAKFEKN